MSILVGGKPGSRIHFAGNVVEHQKEPKPGPPPPRAPRRLDYANAFRVRRLKQRCAGAIEKLNALDTPFSRTRLAILNKFCESETDNTVRRSTYERALTIVVETENDSARESDDDL